MAALKKIITYFVAALLLALTGYLLLLALFSTSVMGPSSNEEHTFFVADSPWRAILVFVLLLAGAVLLKRRGKALAGWAAEHIRGAELVFFILFLCAGTALVLSTRLKPIEDQSIILSTVRSARAGDFSEFTEPGSYYRQFPFQIGIFSFYYFLSFLYGADNYVAPQLLNVIFMAISGIMLSRIVRRLSESAFAGVIALVLYLIYCPVLFYCTYVYGTDVSLMFSLTALLPAMAEPEKITVRTAAAGSVSIALAVLLKSNSLIFLVGIELLLLFHLIFSNKNRKILALFFLLAVLLTVGFRQGNRIFVEHLSGAALADGFPNSYWLVSGFSEGKRAPGWKTHTGLSAKLNENTEEIDALAREMVKERLDTFRAYPGYALEFFSKKIASQWNNPTFECFNMQEGRKSALELGPVLQGLCGGLLSYRAIPFLNIFHSCLLLGVLLYFALNLRRLPMRGLLPGVVTLGGFLFHIVWEGKAKYVFPYFLLFLPYGILGLKSFTEELFIRGEKDAGEFSARRRRLLIVSAAGVLLLLLIQFADSGLLNAVIKISGDGEALKAALETYF
ncbi:MAG: hypothetical protein K5985_07545 [Lachnospiraceae bacterium]|nr:hypothetical protein [Lachnospiraceae bacterium]